MTMHHAALEADLGRRMAAEAKTMRKPNYKAEAPPPPAKPKTTGVSAQTLAEDAKTMTTDQMAFKHGLTVIHLRKRLRSLGIKAQRGISRGEIVTARILEMHGKGMSHRQIGAALHMSHSRIGQRLRELGR